jgi:hypothetical protein
MRIVQAIGSVCNFTDLPSRCQHGAHVTRRDSIHRSGSPSWVKVKNRSHPRVQRVRLRDPSAEITLGEMRGMGIRGLLVYCSDYNGATM